MTLFPSAAGRRYTAPAASDSGQPKSEAASMQEARRRRTERPQRKEGGRGRSEVEGFHIERAGAAGDWSGDRGSGQAAASMHPWALPMPPLRGKQRYVQRSRPGVGRRGAASDERVVAM
ncbi:unnamed protein product [Prorocentrum cordatum]|uniref:Uncharacterized protein n=1 Tax=Prorocentrum cordatum TaxID=2364126 RepID=A0ABN9T7L3_9DINO|nr:unnamed protein product [Polarella glacialis]